MAKVSTGWIPPIRVSRRLLGAVASVAIVGLVAAPGATASVTGSGGVKYVDKRIQVDGKSGATGVAACPRHTHVLGGGELNGGGYGSIKLRQSFPEGKGTTPDDGWEVRVRNGTSKRVPVKVQAICGGTHVQYEKHRFAIPAHTESPEQDLGCPPGTSVYSGGVSAGPGSPIYLNSLFPRNGATVWGTYVDNHGAKTEATLYALCGKKTVDVPQEIVGNSPGTVGGTTTPPCSASRHAYGGGLGTTAGFDGLVINSLGQIPVSGTPGKEWRGLGDVIGSASVDITVHVLCGPALS